LSSSNIPRHEVIRLSSLIVIGGIPDILNSFDTIPSSIVEVKRKNGLRLVADNDAKVSIGGLIEINDQNIFSRKSSDICDELNLITQI
jgi:hypothetical protein